MHHHTRRHILNGIKEVGRSIYGYAKPYLGSAAVSIAEVAKKYLPSDLVEQGLDETLEYLRDDRGSKIRQIGRKAVSDAQRLRLESGWELVGDNINATFGYAPPHSDTFEMKERDMPGFHRDTGYMSPLQRKHMLDAERDLHSRNYESSYSTHTRTLDRGRSIRAPEVAHRELMGVPKMPGVFSRGFSPQQVSATVIEEVPEYIEKVQKKRAKNTAKLNALEMAIKANEKKKKAAHKAKVEKAKVDIALAEYKNADTAAKKEAVAAKERARKAASALMAKERSKAKRKAKVVTVV